MKEFIPIEKRSRSLQWYYEHRDQQIKKMKEWKKQNKIKVEWYKIKQRTEDRENYLAQRKQWNLNNSEKRKEYRRRPEVKERTRLRMRENRKINPEYDKLQYQKHKIKRKEYFKMHNQLPHVKARRNLLARIRNRNNPQSNRSLSLDLQFAMNKVRKRDNNTCQWHECGLTFKEAPIDVHHIFPRSEYPQYELEEKYMICYCLNHHALWHHYRGDIQAVQLIRNRYKINSENLELLQFRGSD